MERITRFRATMLLVLFFALIGFFCVRMYSMQIMGTGNVVDNASAYTTEIRVRAARGDILDCNGNKLVGNRASYNMVFNNFVLLSSADPNFHLQRLVDLCLELEIEYEDHFPVTQTRPYEYTLDQYSESWQDHFQAYLSNLDIDSDISANRLMRELRSRYDIPTEWTDAYARRVIGLRYELALRSGESSLPSFEFIVDVDEAHMTALLELNTPGLTAEVSTVREYYTDYAAHILGYIGKMNAVEWPKYKELGYEMDAYVGKSGLELAFEEYLHGTDGLLRRTVDKEGNIISEYYVTEPVAGNNVEISVDLDLQRVAEQSLADVIKELRTSGVGEQNTGTDVQGASVVALDVKTGKILVCASYPTYNLTTFFDDYNDLLTAEGSPLNNRALDLTYAPGSTFKMVMGIAAIDNGIINRYTEIEDEGVFTKYDGFRPTCMLWGNYNVTHGTLDITTALQESCNYFFYVLGDSMKMAQINPVAEGLGLGVSTGVELPEKIGHTASPESKLAEYGEDFGQWVDGDRITAAIGQSENRFTTLQLAVYVSTIANKGTRYAATFMNRVVADDYSQLLLESEPRVMSTLNISDEAFEAVKEGMIKVTTNGTAAPYFRYWPNNVVVAGKTGTAEHGSGGSNHGSFVCFAPADDPQIAIAVYGEKAGQGGNLSKVAQAIMDQYFSADEASDMITNENAIG